MEARFNRTGAERKALAKAIGEITGADVKYLGMPSASYRIDYFTLTKDGTLEFDDRADSEEVERLFEELAERGFIAENAEPENEPQETEASENITETKTKGDTLTIQMPREFFTDEAIENLNRIIESKGALMKSAFEADDLTIKVSRDKISFPWFKAGDGDEVLAYSHFVTAICEMAKNQKRVTAKEKETENEKYAFRCFLLRLGFIGTQYKAERKVLLKNLTGSSAFKSGQKGGAA